LEFTVRAWFDGGLPDDRAKYDHGNPALMVVVHKLEEYAAEHGQPVVAIPGEDRLPFFFPTWDIRNNRDLDRLPTKLEDLGNADLFVNSAVNEYLLRKAGKWPTSLLADAAVGDAYWWAGVRGDDLANWTVVLWPIQLNINGSLAADDGIFRYNMYTIHPEQRTLPLHPNGPAPGTVIVGGFAQYLGQDMVSLDWVRGEKITLTLYWRPTDQAPPPYDYSIYLHLLDADGNLIAQWDGVPLQKAYPTLFWRPGESLKDLWILRLPPEAPTGPASLRIGIYDPLTGDRLPVVIDGVPSGDGITIETRIQVY
jgi:hypothetical protein